MCVHRVTRTTMKEVEGNEESEQSEAKESVYDKPKQSQSEFDQRLQILLSENALLRNKLAELTPTPSTCGKDVGNHVEFDPLDSNKSQRQCDANMYSVEFTAKPLGLILGATKTNKKHLFVKQIVKDSFAEQKNVLIGSRIVKLQNTVVEELGPKKIYKMVKSILLNDEFPLTITFRKPIKSGCFFSFGSENNLVLLYRE